MNDLNAQLPGDAESSREESACPTAAFQQDGRLYAPKGAALPTDICACCGRETLKTIHKTLRNPKDLRTWFGKTTTVEIGICKKHAENYNVALAITFSLFGVGLIVLGAGVYTMNPSAIVIGLLALPICGVFRAVLPICSPNPRVYPVEIRGVGTELLARIPEAIPEGFDSE